MMRPAIVVQVLAALLVLAELRVVVAWFQFIQS